MPTLAVVKDYLFQLIGKTYTDDQFTDLCFEFGVELDDITSEKEMYMREQGKTSSDASAADKLSDEVIYKIDTPANRYDLLSAEGMAVALKVFLGTMPLPAYRVLNKSAPLYTMTVEKSVKNVRDYVICAVLRNVHFNERSYNSFIDFQEKLHSGLARRRTLASVGTHDLDVIQNTPSNAATKNKFIYGCRPKHTISFIPLRQTTVMHCEGNGLEEFFKDDRHIGKYVPLISSLPNYPVVLDGSGETVLSLPPIINSAHSAISVRTKNIFIECTAPDHQKASVLVNQMVAAFSQFCEEPFTVEAVEVCYEDTCPDGTTREVTPVLDEKELTVSLEKVNNFIGVEIPSAAVCAEHLKKMMHHIKEVNEKEGTVTVLSPAVRSDVIGVSDIMEDVAIGYGYDNIEYKECTTYGDVTQTALGKVSQLLRQEMAAAGYVELLTFSLCSPGGGL
ncbi:phenylalanyl-tRNA synthetase beta chain [Angomonas deanei]|nr:phenylalanyl-tRNA synthetase beta chain [Angomonas deanei]|eukprot:EPY37714.1 phenylalanyl-tRNA synthetase beta chain [Angomonas deanei]